MLIDRDCLLMGIGLPAWSSLKRAIALPYVRVKGKAE